MRFFIDQCVPDSVGRALTSAGHHVELLRKKIAPNSPDPLVAAVAEANGAILVTLDHDFTQLAKRASVGKQRFRNLSLIRLSCREPRAAARMTEAMSLIEHEWDRAQSRPDSRLFIKLGESVITTNR
jgi:predicted nuclease of predicted toxin-antitoxin system